MATGTGKQSDSRDPEPSDRSASRRNATGREREPDRGPGPARIWLGAVVALLLVGGVVAFAVSSGGDDGEDTTGGTGSQETVESTEPAPAEPEVPTEVPDTEAPVTEIEIPAAAIVGADEVQRCAAVVQRLQEYRNLAAITGTTAVGQLFEAASDFEAELFTVAESQDWGDRIIEQLVNVRREWADARSARETDPAAAEEHAATALALLDDTIASADCPT